MEKISNVYEIGINYVNYDKADYARESNRHKRAKQELLRNIHKSRNRCISLMFSVLQDNSE